MTAQENGATPPLCMPLRAAARCLGVSERELAEEINGGRITCSWKGFDTEFIEFDCESLAIHKASLTLADNRFLRTPNGMNAELVRYWKAKYEEWWEKNHAKFQAAEKPAQPAPLAVATAAN